MKCYNCNKEYDDTYKFCPHCSSRNETYKCPDCGENYAKSFKYCPRCGCENYPVTEKLRRRYKTISVVVSVAIIVVVSIIGSVIINKINTDRWNREMDSYRIEGEIDVDIEFRD